MARRLWRNHNSIFSLRQFCFNRLATLCCKCWNRHKCEWMAAEGWTEINHIRYAAILRNTIILRTLDSGTLREKVTNPGSGRNYRHTTRSETVRLITCVLYSVLILSINICQVNVCILVVRILWKIAQKLFWHR